MILWFIYHLTTAYCGAIYLSNKSIYRPINTRGDVIWGCKWGKSRFKRKLVIGRQKYLLLQLRIDFTVTA